MGIQRATPLLKGLIGFGMVAAVMGGYFFAKSKGWIEPTQEAAEASKNGVNIPFLGGDHSAPAASGGTVGTPGSPLKVSIVSFHGYAPALYANGGSLQTQQGSLFARKGVNVEFLVQDNVPASTEILGSGTAHCFWRTSDFWAQEQPNLRESKLDARAIMVVDNTQGADAIISNQSSIQNVEGLAGHRVAMLQYTPSHGLFVNALGNSSLTGRQKQSIKPVYIQADEGTAGVRAALESGSVEAAVLWDPDLSLALKTIPGTHIIYSTKVATNLIYDVMVCDQRILQNPANYNAILAFVDGWTTGAKEVNANKDLGVQALVKTEPSFKLLSEQQGPAFVAGLFDNIVLTDLASNVRILGLAGGTNHYERVYSMFDEVYRGIGGTLINSNSPVINPSDSFDYRFVQALMAKDSSAQVESKKPEFTFNKAEAVAVQKKAAPVVTKPVEVHFATGSADLNARSRNTLDNEMAPLVENFGNAYFTISGNTDSTGSPAINKRLSLARAQVVLEYLVHEWEFQEERFVVEGNGSDKPLCDEGNPDTSGLNLEECRALNRTTRIAVMGK